MIELGRELRVTLRELRRAPGFTVSAVLMLALAIGANTAVFSAVEAVLLHPIPVRGLDALVVLETNLPGSIEHMPMAPAEVYDLDDRRDLFLAVGGYRAVPVNLTGAGEPQRVAAISTVGSLFAALGIRPYLGRFYDSTDVRRGNTHVAVLTYDYWRAFTGGDRKAIGRRLQLDDSTYRVIGVLPPGFRYPEDADLWTPQPLVPGLDARDNRCCKLLTTIGRLRPGVTAPQLRSQLAAEMNDWHEQFPAIYELQQNAGSERQTLTTLPLRESLAGQLRPILLLLVGGVAFVLLIACANLASLQLVRTTGHAREIAIRVALGAHRRRIVARLALESLVLAVSGGALGIVLGMLLLLAVRRSGAAQLAMLAHVRLDPLVLGCSAVVTFGTALLFGIVPALRAASIEPGDVLKASSRAASASAGRSRFLRSAVIAQVALSLILLLGSAVALRSLNRLLKVDPGFRPDGVMRLRLSLASARYAPAAARVSFHNALLARLQSVPGVVAVGTVSGSPFGYLKESEHSTMLPVATEGAARPTVHASIWVVGGEYFRAMGIPLLAGRTFTSADGPRSPRVWLMDPLLARGLFGSHAAVGAHVAWQSPPPTIVGIVGAVKKSDLAHPDQPSVYWSYQQYPGPDLTVVMRSALPSSAAARVMREAVRELDPALPVFDMAPMTQGIARSLGPRRLGTAVLTAFAALALLLATLGVYSVSSYATSQRTKEIGIRIALGARPGQVLRLMLGSEALLAGAGIVAGSVVFALLGPALSSIVYDLSPRDPLTFVIAAAALLFAALLASWIPARRAAGIDAMEALRAE